MEKIKYRAVIKYFFLKKKTNYEIGAELSEVHGDHCTFIIDHEILNLNAAVESFLMKNIQVVQMRSPH